MERACRVFAADGQITLAGEKLQAKGLRVQDTAEIEQYLLAKRPNALKVAKDNLALFADDPAARETILRIAMEQETQKTFVTRGEVYTWLNSLDGFMFGVWLSVRHNGPKYTLDYVTAALTSEMNELLGKAGEEAWKKRKDEIQETIDASGGSDPRSNSTGPTSAI